jgi:hypothetical protein
MRRIVVGAIMAVIGVAGIIAAPLANADDQLPGWQWTARLDTPAECDALGQKFLRSSSDQGAELYECDEKVYPFGTQWDLWIFYNH